MSKAIEAAIRSKHWKKARQLVRAELRKEPGSHWLITRLGLTFYEERAYRTSLAYSQKALKLAPGCPLVLWDYAGALQMLGKHRLALRVYRQLLSRGVERIAYGDCGEGRRWARGLIADCHYRVATSYRKLKKRSAAIDSYQKHLKMRGPGCSSIYAVRTVRKELSELIFPHLNS
jgi:tetratricopeptide (TPR) repeat protein